MTKFAALLAVFTVALLAGAQAVTYTQTFDDLGTNGLPAGWSVSSDATITSIGGQNATFTQAATSWGTTSFGFRNSASSVGLIETSTPAQQAASTDRALGLRQTGTGDPGAAFNFSFSSTGATISNISLDLMMLSVQGRSTSFSIQYGIGSNPSSFTTIGAYNDPGTFGSMSLNFTTADFGNALDNQSAVVFRVVALTASTGSGSRDTVGLDNFSIISSSAITPLAIPEPATYMLFGMGLLVCVQQFRRRRASAK